MHHPHKVEMCSRANECFKNRSAVLFPSLSLRVRARSLAFGRDRKSASEWHIGATVSTPTSKYWWPWCLFDFSASAMLATAKMVMKKTTHTQAQTHAKAWKAREKK